MLLLELFHWKDGATALEYGYDVMARAKRAGIERQDKDLLDDLELAIEEYEEALHSTERDKPTGEGRPSLAADAYNIMVIRIKAIEEQIRASKGRGPSMKHRREYWTDKQDGDPVSQHIRSLKRPQD